MMMMVFAWPITKPEQATLGGLDKLLINPKKWQNRSFKQFNTVS